MTRFILGLFLGFSYFVSADFVSAATSAPAAAVSQQQQAVMGIFEELKSVASSSLSDSQKQSKLIEIYKKHTDQATLWARVFPKAQQDQAKYAPVKTAFEGFNARLFSKNLGSFKNAALTFGREIKNSDGTVSVQSQISKPDGKVRVVWVMLGDKITNLIVDDISLTNTFRDQLNDLDRQYGSDAQKLAQHIENAGK